MTAALLAILLHLGPAASDRAEPFEDRFARLDTIAAAVVDSSHRAACAGSYDEPGCQPVWTEDVEGLAGLLTAVGWYESRFARNVHAGACRRDECDWDGVRHRARTPWQLHRTDLVRADWDRLEGTAPLRTRNAAWAAARVISWAVSRCGGWDRGLVLYATGKHCRTARFPQAEDRAGMAARIAAELRQ